MDGVNNLYLQSRDAINRMLFYDFFRALSFSYLATTRELSGMLV